MRPRRKNDYNSMSPAGKSLASRAKRAFAKDYPDAVVSIDGRMGWIIVDGKKAVNLSQASSRAMTLEDALAKMEQTYLGSTMQESTMRITESKLRRIIRRVIKEGRPDWMKSPEIDPNRVYSTGDQGIDKHGHTMKLLVDLAVSWHRPKPHQNYSDQQRADEVYREIRAERRRKGIKKEHAEEMIVHVLEELGLEEYIREEQPAPKPPHYGWHMSDR
jgi:hypothetical protein